MPRRNQESKGRDLMHNITLTESIAFPGTYVLGNYRAMLLSDSFKTARLDLGADALVKAQIEEWQAMTKAARRYSRRLLRVRIAQARAAREVSRLAFRRYFSDDVDAEMMAGKIVFN